MKVKIEQETIQNENLKNIKDTESSLRKNRDKQEADMLNIASQT